MQSVLSALLDCHPSAEHMASSTATLLPGSVHYNSSSLCASRQGPRCPHSAPTSWLFWLTSPAGPHCTSASGFCLAGTGSKGESCFSGLGKELSWATLSVWENTRPAMFMICLPGDVNQPKIDFVRRMQISVLLICIPWYKYYLLFDGSST